MVFKIREIFYLFYLESVFLCYSEEFVIICGKEKQNLVERKGMFSFVREEIGRNWKRVEQCRMNQNLLQYYGMLQKEEKFSNHFFKQNENSNRIECSIQTKKICQENFQKKRLKIFYFPKIFPFIKLLFFLCIFVFYKNVFKNTDFLLMLFLVD